MNLDQLYDKMKIIKERNEKVLQAKKLLAKQPVINLAEAKKALDID